MVRLQDGMAMVRLQDEDRTCWFKDSDIAEYYEQSGREDCIRVDPDLNVAITAGEFVLDAQAATLRCAGPLRLDGQGGVHAAAPHVDVRAGSAVLAAERTLELRAEGASLRLGRCVSMEAESCEVLGVLRASEVVAGEVALGEAVRRLEEQVRELQQLIRQRAEGGSAAGGAVRPGRWARPTTWASVSESIR